MVGINFEEKLERNTESVRRAETGASKRECCRKGWKGTKKKKKHAKKKIR